MCFGLDPFRLLLISVSGWMSQQQRDVIDYLQENRVLRQQLGQPTSPQRRAALAFGS
jgi:hypothetical protein